MKHNSYILQYWPTLTYDITKTRSALLCDGLLLATRVSSVFSFSNQIFYDVFLALEMIVLMVLGAVYERAFCILVNISDIKYIATVSQFGMAGR